MTDTVKVKFLRDKGFAKEGSIWDYPPEVADRLIVEGAAEKVKATKRAKPKPEEAAGTKKGGDSE